jgi:hypothetical protein
MHDIRRFVLGFAIACVICAAQPASASTVLALYTFGDTGVSDSDFDTARFDSIDTDPWTTASRLAQGGGLTGGDAGNFIYDSPGMGVGETTSGPQNLNVAGVNTVDFATATGAGDFFSFTITPIDDPWYVETVYQSLTFFSNTGDTGNPSVEVTLNGNEIETIMPVLNNSSAGLFEMLLGNFTSSDPVTIRFTLWGTAAPENAIRFDDIQLIGQQVVVPEPSTAALLVLGVTLVGAGGYSRWRKSRG